MSLLLSQKGVNPKGAPCKHADVGMSGNADTMHLHLSPCRCITTVIFASRACCVGNSGGGRHQAIASLMSHPYLQSILYASKLVPTVVEWVQGYDLLVRSASLQLL